MKRYRNPDIFENLAISYALGTLQGKARLRFKKLMEKHVYLREVTVDYQQKLAPLAGLLPSQHPPASVWKNIYKEIKNRKRKVSSTWLLNLRSYLPWSIAAVSSITASVMALLFLNIANQPPAYMAMMTSPEQQNKIVVAVINHAQMEVSFSMPKGTLPPDKNMEPTFWLIPKDKNIPVRVGTLVRGGKYRMSFSRTLWKQLKNIGEFAISMEPVQTYQTNKPTGKIIFSGDITAL